MGESWVLVNQRQLVAALARLRGVLERHAGGEAPEADAMPGERPPTLALMQDGFGLSDFETSALLLAAAPDLDFRFSELCAAAQGGLRPPYPTFGLALAALPGAHWSAFTPGAALRRWALLEPPGTHPFSEAPLRLNERVLHFVAGAGDRDGDLHGLIRLVAVEDVLPPSQRQVADRLAALWSRAAAYTDGAGAIPELLGRGVAAKIAVAAEAAATVGLRLGVVDASRLGAQGKDIAGMARLLEREAVLGAIAVLVDADDVNDPETRATVSGLAAAFHGPLAVAARERLTGAQRAGVALDVDHPLAQEQRELWLRLAGPDAPVEALVSEFDLDPAAIRATARLAEHPGQLWSLCRAQTRPRLGALAQRIEPTAGWDELVVTPSQHDLLAQLALHVRHRSTVYDTWGMVRGRRRGLGTTALFAGPSGTGKTMAAEVVARELDLDLYRIDLSAVVSKYIGETEKNLRQVFDGAESGGVVLLFDEAEALFGKRSEVKDSHDRYANIEIAYLLQRMEEYRGLAILTTNMRESLDPAFLRRIRFVVEFPFPGPELRTQIWNRAFPTETPTRDIDAPALARLNLAGGAIRNVALAAAFLAAGDGQVVEMRHLLRAARVECAKLDQPYVDPMGRL